MRQIEVSGEYIKLGQLLKLAGITGSGSDAKMLIQDGQIKLNGSVCTERGKKVRSGDIIKYLDDEIQIIT